MNPLRRGGARGGCLVLRWGGIAGVWDGGPPPRVGSEGPAGAGGRRRGALARFYEYLSDRLAPRAVGMIGERRRDKIRRRLDAAGKPGGMTLERYAGRKAAFTVVMGGAGFLFLLQGRVVLFVTFTVMGFVWIDIWLSGLARRRQARIERDLPDFLDILAVTVAAGVGFRPALVRVSEALGGPLGEEMMVALRQMDLGFGRRQAFEAVRDRNESESLDVFVTALLQAEELGVPLADALGNLAEDMRRSFYQAARRRAARASPRVSLIVSLLIVPGALVLIIASIIVGSDITPGSLLGG